MTFAANRRALVLFVGDILCLIIGLWLTLLLRYLAWPDSEQFMAHLVPFSFLFILWLLVFFISDLYRRQTVLSRIALPRIILRAQAINVLLAAAFFYFSENSTITPKVNLFINLIVTSALLLWWRLHLVDWLIGQRRENFIFLCHGKEVDRLKEEIEHNPKYKINLWSAEDLEQIKDRGWLTVIINPYDERLNDSLPNFYKMIFSGVRFVSFHQLYEDVFDRIPLSFINERWFVENISNHPKHAYEFVKRVMDLLLAGVLFVISLPFEFLAYLAIKLHDGGPVFYHEERVGKDSKTFRISKFRTMSTEPALEARQITKPGGWLRRSRIDELPQLLSVLKGEQSLVGPRPERPDYVDLYRRDLPFYDARHLIPPGLSGWAQLYQENHPHFGPSTEATAEKLSYDLYYLKNRSLWLDVKIALKTIKALLSRTGI